MAESDFETIFAALNNAGARYLVVGGVAVVLHGYPRFTADLDLVINLEPNNTLAALQALEQLGYRPRAPVPIAQFADPDIRRKWIEEKGLTVFSLWSPNFPATAVDVFVREPFIFDQAYTRALHTSLGAGEIHVASISDLIVLKKISGRPKDLDDIAVLTKILEANADD